MCRWLICGVDETHEARDAVRVAARMADALGLRLQLVSAVTARGGDGRAAARAAAAIERVDRRLPDGAVHRVEVGPAHECLIAVADEVDADAIVVGSRGRSAVAAALRGSVSAQVVAAAGRPVVVVPPGAREGFLGGPRATPCRVVCGVDGSSNAGDAAAHAALVSRRIGAQLVLCHVDAARGRSPLGAGPGVTPAPPATIAAQRVERPQALEAALERMPDPPEIRTAVETGSPARRLAAAAERHEAELIVVGAGADAWRPTLVGAVTRGLLARSPCPVMAVPPQRAPAYEPRAA